MTFAREIYFIDVLANRYEMQYMTLIYPPTSQTASHVAPCVAPDTALMLLFCQAQVGAVVAALWTQTEGVELVQRINHAAHPARLSQVEGMEFACLAVATSPLMPAALYEFNLLSVPLMVVNPRNGFKRSPNKRMVEHKD